MDRHRLGLTLAGVALLLTAGCVERTASDDIPSTSDTTTTTVASDTATAPVGYPKPVGERREIPPGGYDQIELRAGDVIVVELEIPPADSQYDQEIIVLAEVLGEHQYAFQAIAPGETRIVTAEPPAGSCGDGEEDGCTGRPAPPTIDITVTA